MQLVIGNKNYSSWSLRAWLLLAAHDIPFEEIRIPLNIDSTAGEIGRYTAAGRVPVLVDAGIAIWDSLAICEYISEQYLSGRGWPADLKARALARACSAEMHSGFFRLREAMPMNCRARDRQVSISTELGGEISRIDSLWTGLRNEHATKGPWLFGEFTIADCMFAPVVSRFTTYNVTVSTQSAAYMQTMLDHDKIQQWLAAAKDEVEVIDVDERG